VAHFGRVWATGYQAAGITALDWHIPGKDLDDFSFQVEVKLFVPVEWHKMPKLAFGAFRSIYVFICHGFAH
jgi:hypothetical protein